MSDFDKYIRQGEPGQVEKARIWQTAIGLQDVDGLKPSPYLKETAQRHIEGDITIDQVRSLLDDYYQSKTARGQVEERTEEADKVSAAIAAILSENTFTFSPDYLISIHRRLFTGIYQFAGQIRDYNISKKEWVLDGASVLYSDTYMIRQTLDYDFAQERKFSYSGISLLDTVRHIAGFISGMPSSGPTTTISQRGLRLPISIWFFSLGILFWKRTILSPIERCMFPKVSSRHLQSLNLIL